MSQFLCSSADKKMAESKGSMLAKSVSKHAGRAKEKILQNLGKVDRTADDIFDEHLQNFTKQQNSANRLQKEFNNYIRCVRAVQAASKSLMDSLNEVYESGWLGHDLLYAQSMNIEMLFGDFTHKLADQVLIPLNTYQAQFPEMRKKIEKRGRKLVDYDSQRHNAQSVQSTSGSIKKKDEAKLLKAREQLEDAKRTYEMLNSELHDELPALYDSRVLFLVTNLQTYFAAEQIFHSETSKVFAELEAVVDRLATDCQRGSYSVKKLQGLKGILNHSNNKLSSPVSSHASVNEETACTPIDATTSNNTIEESSTTTVVKEDENTNKESNTTHQQQQVNGISENKEIVQKSENSSIDKEEIIISTKSTTKDVIISTSSSSENNNATSTVEKITTNGGGNNDDDDHNEHNEDNNNVKNKRNNKITNGNTTTATTNGNKQVEELFDIPAGATTDNLPPGVLYKVKATYKYTQEDIDELSFDVGEIIRVVEYDDPEEQEEGWLMGIKESNGEKGMFPANFTRPL